MSPLNLLGETLLKSLVAASVHSPKAPHQLVLSETASNSNRLPMRHTSQLLITTERLSKMKTPNHLKLSRPSQRLRRNPRNRRRNRRSQKRRKTSRSTGSLNDHSANSTDLLASQVAST